MIDVNKIMLELRYFEEELRQFEKNHSNQNGFFYNENKDDFSEEYYNEYIYIMKSIDNCHSNYAHALVFNEKMKLRQDKLIQIEKNEH